MTYRSGDFNSNTRLITTWKWPFKQQNTIKVTRQPLGFANDDDDKMLPNDKFIFPDATVIKPSPSLQTRIGAAPSCNGKTFCEQVSDYPSSFVRDAIKNDRSLQNYANVDSLDFTFRINTASTESLCVATEQIVYPKTAQNANKQWLYVLNVANFTQGVRIETCMQEDQGCNIIGGFAEGYVTTCKQKYIHRQLAAIVDGAVSHELFRFPASCCCHVQFVGTSTRMRIGKTSNAQDKPDDINAN
ncbi:PREDICTED: protein spaetzle-like [Habropoda laboriosa]|uniref:protein spaetzle-like n=1 Tax=Habropoda laboriosa TaxID=597456 RepID=UPI00083CD38E|nr:PREDICTED: protein spaetzle-like [Habropoda laboriosa]